MEIVIDQTEEKRLRAELEKRTDAQAARMSRFLNMPDLSRQSGHPLAEMATRIVALPTFKNFDLVTTPEIIEVEKNFDLFNVPANHPLRSPSDTYYVDENHLLRTQTTIMWYYHLQLPTVQTKLAAGQSIGALSYGKVYRKDEIDRNHMNVFHQIDGWFLCQKTEKVIDQTDLENVLINIAQAIFGPEVKYRFNPDTFPFTHPSLEMEIQIGERWIEVLGSGVVHPQVLENLGVDSNKYNGWAFGFGLERLAILSMELPDIRLLWSTDERVKRQLKLGQKYKEVSKYPAITRDISFVVPKSFIPNNYFDLIRDIGGDLIEEMGLLDKFESGAKFGADKVSYTYRIVYRSIERTLTAEEIAPIQNKIVEETKKQFGAEMR